MREPLLAPVLDAEPPESVWPSTRSPVAFACDEPPWAPASVQLTHVSRGLTWAPFAVALPGGGGVVVVVADAGVRLGGTLTSGATGAATPLTVPVTACAAPFTTPPAGGATDETAPPIRGL